MKHYVQYHNTELMGYPCGEIDSDSFSIVTDKSVSNLPGNMLWLICGEGKPRRYSLDAVFIVDEIGLAEPSSGFKHYASGEVGTSFRPPISLNKRSWFKEFMRDYQNFSLGVREIQERKYIAELEKLAGRIEEQKIEEQLKVGAGFGNLETNRRVERAAISFVTEWYEGRGWSVRSVEAEKCGYDLRCVKGEIEEHVEVKGVQGAGLSFIITANEVRQAHVDSSFVICVVNSALSDKPQMSRYTGDEFVEKFNLDALAFRANLRT